MPLHPSYLAKMHLLDGIESFEEAFAHPDQAARIAEFMASSTTATLPPAEIRTCYMEGQHGPIRLKVYRRQAEDLDQEAPSLSTVPAVLWAHGGAFRMGDTDDIATDRTSREICRRTGAVVVAVEYRLAINGVHYPVPLDDVVAAARWLRDHSEELAVNPLSILLAGESAGANLAAAAALRLRDEDWAPAGLVLAYPVMHPQVPPHRPSVAADLSALPPLLRFLPQDVKGMVENYLGAPDNTADGYAMPGLANVEGLCPTLIFNSEYDDLRTSGEVFAASLASAGVDVRQVLVPGMLHAFLQSPGDFEELERVYAEMAEFISHLPLSADARVTSHWSPTS